MPCVPERMAREYVKLSVWPVMGRKRCLWRSLMKRGHPDGGLVTTIGLPPKDPHDDDDENEEDEEDDSEKEEEPAVIREPDQC